MHYFVGWRRAARAVTDSRAIALKSVPLVIGGARLEPVTAAEITAAALAQARVPPLWQRPLLEADERPGAAPVVALGYTVWQRQFGGRAGIVGQSIQIGRDTTTVVGVMPAGLRLPRQPSPVDAADRRLRLSGCVAEAGDTVSGVHRRWLTGKAKPSGHDADDGRGVPPDPNVSSDDAGTSAELPLDTV